MALEVGSLIHGKLLVSRAKAFSPKLETADRGEGGKAYLIHKDLMLEHVCSRDRETRWTGGELKIRFLA